MWIWITKKKNYSFNHILYYFLGKALEDMNLDELDELEDDEDEEILAQYR